MSNTPSPLPVSSTASHKPCAICHGDRFVWLDRFEPKNSAFEKSPIQILQCLSCDSITIHRPEPLTASELPGLTHWRATNQSGGPTQKIQAVQLLQKIGHPITGNLLLLVGLENWHLPGLANKMGWRVTLVDTPERIGTLKKISWLKSYTLAQFQDGRLPFQSATFDTVFMDQSIQTFREPKTCLKEIHRVLKHEGFLWISFVDIQSWLCAIFHSRWWGLVIGFDHFFSKSSIRWLLVASGFKNFKFFCLPRVLTMRALVKRLQTFPSVFSKALWYVCQLFELKNQKLSLALPDQKLIQCKKREMLESLSESHSISKKLPQAYQRVIVVLPAYNAKKTLEKTVSSIPKKHVHSILLVDDASQDGTAELAKKMGLRVFSHTTNKGYGANQKTCYTKALEMKADIVIMLHPDYQYNPKLIPQLIEPILRGQADAVFGSRMLRGGALEGGMPRWKYNANIFLTALANIVLGTYLSEYHSGFRAYHSRVLNSVRFESNSDGFIFDTEIIVQCLSNHFRMAEIPIQTRYFDEASSIGLGKSLQYGFGILWVLFRTWLHKKNIFRYSILFPKISPSS